MNGTQAALLAGVMVGIGLLVTAPLWLPRLFGQTPTRCECGARIGPSGIAPYFTCDY